MGCLYVIFIRPFVLLWQLFLDLLQLLPYVLGILLIWFLFTYFSWGNLDFLGDRSWEISWPWGAEATPTASSPVAVATAPARTQEDRRYPLIFRFTWQGEEIYYLGNSISEGYFQDLAREAKALGAKVECEVASDVTVGTADRRRDYLDSVGVPYEIIPLG
jgi:hypothetical protein